MFPIFAVGAAIVSAIVAKEVIEASTEEASKASKQKEPETAARPQSYLVTPMGSGGTPVETVSALDAVRKFIV